jgi:DNA topoisomerase I
MPASGAAATAPDLELVAARLRRVDWTEPGITRRRCGQGFCYLDPTGRRIADPAALERIRRLAIPPAWRDVWICPDPMGHLQAVGIDAAGRRQYRYHDLFRARRDLRKFDHMLAFARALPALRRAVSADIVRDGLERDRVLATAVRLLDRGFFRIGSERYKQKDGTFGLATLLKEHVRAEGSDTLVFDFFAKHHKRWVRTVVDAEVAGVVRRLKRRRGGGDELLAWNERGRWVDVRSTDVNGYIKRRAGGDYTAKEFRTWGASVLAFVSLAEAGPPPPSKTARARLTADTVRRVADYLGNTPAVARKSYIDPRILDSWASGEAAKSLAAASVVSRAGGATGAMAEDRLRAEVERAVLELLDRGGPEVARRSA